jgi:hypothetical protein
MKNSPDTNYFTKAVLYSKAIFLCALCDISRILSCEDIHGLAFNIFCNTRGGIGWDGMGIMIKTKMGANRRKMREEEEASDSFQNRFATK